MQECETSAGKDSIVKRVTVRSGGAGHAHSGIVKGDLAATMPTSEKGRPNSSMHADRKIVRLGR